MKKLFLLAGIAAVTSIASAEELGRLCVQNTFRPKNAIREPLTDGDASTGHIVWVQVDNGPKLRVSDEQGADFHGIPPKGKHTVSVYDPDGKKRLLAVPFQFTSEDSFTLCMAQNTIYRTWMLSASGDHCTCPGPRANR